MRAQQLAPFGGEANLDSTRRAPFPGLAMQQQRTAAAHIQVSPYRGVAASQWPCGRATPRPSQAGPEAPSRSRLASGINHKTAFGRAVPRRCAPSVYPFVTRFIHTQEKKGATKEEKENPCRTKLSLWNGGRARASRGSTLCHAHAFRPFLCFKAMFCFFILETFHGQTATQTKILF